MKKLDAFKKFEIKELSRIKGGTVVYENCGGNTCVYDCHQGHDNPNDIHCIKMGEIAGLTA